MPAIGWIAIVLNSLSAILGIANLLFYRRHPDIRPRKPWYRYAQLVVVIVNITAIAAMILLR